MDRTEKTEQIKVGTSIHYIDFYFQCFEQQPKSSKINFCSPYMNGTKTLTVQCVLILAPNIYFCEFKSQTFHLKQFFSKQRIDYYMVVKILSKLTLAYFDLPFTSRRHHMFFVVYSERQKKTLMPPSMMKQNQQVYLLPHINHLLTMHHLISHKDHHCTICKPLEQRRGWLTPLIT